MAGKTLINGTAYTVKGGKTKVNGTGYSISKGITLIGGVAKTISFLNKYILFGSGTNNLSIYQRQANMVVTFNTDNINFSCTSMYNTVVCLSSISGIDLSKYTKIKLDIQLSTSDSGTGITMHVNDTYPTSWWQGTQIYKRVGQSYSRQTIEIPISFNATKYVTIHVHGPMSAKIYNFWLE